MHFISHLLDLMARSICAQHRNPSPLFRIRTGTGKPTADSTHKPFTQGSCFKS